MIIICSGRMISKMSSLTVQKLLIAIEEATGRTISGKDSDEVQQAFGAALN